MKPSHQDAYRARQETSVDRTRLWGRVWLVAWLAVAAVLLARPLWLSGWRAGDASQQIASASPTAGVELTSPSFTHAAPRTQLVHEFRPIEQLRVGQRVISDNPDVAPADKLGGATAVDPATWRLLRLYAEEIWPDGTVDTIHITTLQPPEWIALWGAEVGAKVPPPLDLLEMGISEDLLARVVDNQPCPPLEDPLPGADPGRLVLTTVNHLNNDVWRLTATPVRGPPSATAQNSEATLAQEQTLHPTGFHRFYSETRAVWVATNELQQGEIIRGRTGPLRVASATQLPGTQRVYNLTVEGEHVYYVGKAALLTHNNCDIPRAKLGSSVNLAEFRRLNIADPATKRFRPGEASAAVEVQSVIGRLERAATPNVDFVVTSGANKGKTVDFFFTADSPSAVANLNKHFLKNLNGNQIGLLNHLKKADIVPLDFRVLDSTNQSAVLKYLRSLPTELRTKALILE